MNGRLARVWRLIDRRWLRPPQVLLAAWALVGLVAGSLLGADHAGHGFTVGQAIALAVLIVALVPLSISGARTLVNSFVGPARAWLIRRNTGRSVHFRRGQLYERRRHARLKQQDPQKLD